MAKIIGIIENNSVTGVRYGTIEIPEPSTNIKRTYKQVEAIRTQQKRKIRSEHTKKK